MEKPTNFELVFAGHIKLEEKLDAGFGYTPVIAVHGVIGNVINSETCIHYTSIWDGMVSCDSLWSDRNSRGMYQQPAH